MTPTLATVAAWSYGLAALGYTAFAAYLTGTSRGSGYGRALLLSIAITAAWALLNLGFLATGAQSLLRVGAAVDVLRLGAWYVFLLVLIEGSPVGAEPDGARPRSWLVPAAGLLVVAGVLAQLLLAAESTQFGDPGRLAAIASLCLTIFGLMLVERLFRGASEGARWGFKPLCLGLAAALAFDLYLFANALLFSRVDADAWSVRGFVGVVVLPLFAITALRSGGWTRNFALSRRVAFHSTALLASGVYLLFMAAAGYYVRYFGGSWGAALQVALVFAASLALVAMAASGSLRAKLRVLVSKHFFSFRYDYRDEWLRFTHALSGRGGQTELRQSVVKGLADLLESPAGSLWLKDGTGRNFVQSARWNMPVDPATEPAESEFANFLSETGWVVSLEEYRSSPERYRGLRIPLWLSESPNAWLVIPLSNGSELIGFVILATARTRVDVNWEVNDLLKTAARQAATFLGQAQATEELLEARKFDAFNRMSAFVVHDLKNIVAQLSLMVKNAERHRDNPEFQRDMLMTVEHSVERMKQLMMQLREGTTPVDAPQGVDLAAVVDHVQRAKASQRPATQLKVDEKVIARGHPHRIERVIGHLVQNAIDATGKEGSVWIRLGRRNGQALVEVGDTGSGMTPEFVRDRLFKPFQTTKPTGMGIGAYESFQYVQELGGRVQVDSTPGKGTRVELLLPLFEAPAVGIVAAHRESA